MLTSVQEHLRVYKIKQATKHIYKNQSTMQVIPKMKNLITDSRNIQARTLDTRILNSGEIISVIFY